MKHGFASFSGQRDKRYRTTRPKRVRINPIPREADADLISESSMEKAAMASTLYKLPFALFK